MTGAVLKLFSDMLVAERGLSLKTKESYLSDLKMLSKTIDKDPSTATDDDLKSYFHRLAKENVKTRTIRRKYSAFKAFYSFLVLEKIRKNNPLAALEAPSNERSLPKYLSHEEVEQLLNAAETPEMICLVELLYATGLRVSELVTLRLSNIKASEGILIVAGKGLKERIVPIHQKALLAIKNHLKSRTSDSPFLFPSKEKNGHLSRQAFFKKIKLLARDAGLDETRISPHVLRHSFASHLLAGDVDLRTLQEMLGHASISTTEIYTHIQDDRLMKMLKSKHPLSKIDFKDL